MFRVRGLGLGAYQEDSVNNLRMRITGATICFVGVVYRSP